MLSYAKNNFKGRNAKEVRGRLAPKHVAIYAKDIRSQFEDPGNTQRARFESLSIVEWWRRTPGNAIEQMHKGTINDMCKGKH